MIDTSLTLSLRGCVQLFQFFQICCQYLSCSDSSPRSAHSRERSLATLSCQIFAGSFGRRRMLFPKCITGDLNGSPNRLSNGVPICQRGLGHFADSNSIRWNLTTTFHPILIVATLLMYLLSLIGQLFHRYHLSPIDEMLRCGDSMIKLQMLSQIPSSCLHRQISVLATVPTIFPTKSSFCSTQTNWI